MSELVLTPILKQYLSIKGDYPDAIVFFRLGDFYEMFFDDAIVASKVLEIALTKKNKNENVPMCGVPYHAVKNYLNKLINNSYKVVIVEQLTEPGKGLVERDVVRVITKGTILEDELLNSGTNNYIGALLLLDNGYYLSYIDISTGDAYVSMSLLFNEALQIVESINISEIVLTKETPQSIKDAFKEIKVYVSVSELSQTLNIKEINDLSSEQKKVTSFLLNHIKDFLKKDMEHLTKFEIIKSNDYLNVSKKDRLALDIDNDSNNTLYNVLNYTQTSMGKRLLHQFFEYPLVDKLEIEKRLDFIESFSSNYQCSLSTSKLLDEIYDINRIVSKITYQTVSPKDLINLRDTLNNIPKLKNELLKFNRVNIDNLSNNIIIDEELIKLINNTLVDNPPFTVKEGGIFLLGYNSELDHLRNISEDSLSYLQMYLTNEREKTGIKSLKIGYTKTFGYYIEVSNSFIPLIKAEYGYYCKQTLTTGQRYITDELKEKESEILSAKYKAVELEYTLFTTLREEILKYRFYLLDLAKKIAYIDCYNSLSIASVKNNYVRPTINLEKTVEIIDSRHPIVERNCDFIRNNINIKDSQLLLITGPNMAGKSTYMRSLALIAFMTQIGSFVPAKKCSICLYDSIYTRIGASDELFSGKSTFYVEMEDCNRALSSATDKSLIIFDEIGRGTSTFDGISLACGILFYIINVIKAHTMFSTHYHELFNFLEGNQNIVPLYVEAITSKSNITFLHKVKEGVSDRSYGILVAKLAHLPLKVTNHSEKILTKLEKDNSIYNVNLFNYDKEDDLKDLNRNSQNIINEIKKISLDTTTPMDALLLLKTYQKKLENDDENK